MRRSQFANTSFRIIIMYMLHTVIFIGRSGCGKGTQADLLRNRISRLDPDKRPILYIGTGDKFREFVRGETFSSKLSRAIYEADERQPDFLACWAWSSILTEELGEDMHIIFDGAPRSKLEANLVSTAMKFYKRDKLTVIYLRVSRKWSEERLLSRSRGDDLNLTKIDKRLDWFDEDTLPAVEYFKNNRSYRFLDIDGEQTIEKVHADIIAAYDYTS